jgi:hypothetical protein
MTFPDRDTLDKAVEALDRIPREQRDYSTMTAKDPRVLRKNPRLPYIQDKMGICWGTYKSKVDYDIKRNAIVKLRILLDEWLAEPGCIRDLESGACTNHSNEPWSDATEDNAVFPFDDPGPCSDLFFYHSGASMSELMTKELWQKHSQCLLGRFAYGAVFYEKCYASLSPTKAFFTSDQAFSRHAGAPRDDRCKPGSFVVFGDSAGNLLGHTLITYRCMNLQKAKDRADSLSQQFEIRFLVGKTIGFFDTH